MKCAVGGDDILGAEWWEAVIDGESVALCRVHAVIWGACDGIAEYLDAGHIYAARFADHIDAFLNAELGRGCPQPLPLPDLTHTEPAPMDDDSRQALDRIWGHNQSAFSG